MPKQSHQLEPKKTLHDNWVTWSNHPDVVGISSFGATFASGSSPTHVFSLDDRQYFTPQLEYTDEEETAALAHNLEVTTTESEHFTYEYAVADTVMARFAAVREFIANRRAQLLEADASGAWYDYDAANVAFTAYQNAYNQTDSVYIRRCLKWGMNREIHAMGVFEYEGEAFFDEQGDGTTDRGLNSLSQDILKKHPEYTALFAYATRLAQDSPGLSAREAYPPNPYGELLHTTDISQQGSTFNYSENFELAIETSSLFGVGMDDLSEAARGQLVEYGLRLNETTYTRLKELSEQLPNTVDKVQFAEAFLATEFGDDLGGQLLVLAEHSQNNPELSTQLGYVGNILGSVRTFTTEGTLAEVSPDLADDVRRGISTRTSEILYALNQRLDKNKPTGKIETALAKLDEWASGVATMLQNGIPQKVQETGDTKLYHFIDKEAGKKYPGAVELTTNGKFADAATPRERYVKEGRGARISLTYDTAQPEIALSLNGVKRRGAMNGRLDKSVYNITANQSEPDAEHAEVSFDIASIHGVKEGESRMVAEVIAEGSAIRDTGNGNRGGAKNFTYDIIDQQWGGREKFAGAVYTLGDVLDSRERVHRRELLARGAIRHAQ